MVTNNAFHLLLRQSIYTTSTLRPRTLVTLSSWSLRADGPPEQLCFPLKIIVPASKESLILYFHHLPPHQIPSLLSLADQINRCLKYNFFRAPAHIISFLPANQPFTTPDACQPYSPLISSTTFTIIDPDPPPLSSQPHGRRFFQSLEVDTTTATLITFCLRRGSSRPMITRTISNQNEYVMCK